MQFSSARRIAPNSMIPLALFAFQNDRMDSEIQLPLSLVKRMNDDDSIKSIRAWGIQTSDDTLGGTAKIPALYDKQRAKFVDKMESIELRGMIDDYKRRNQTDNFWADFTPESFTWQQVHELLQRSQEKYQQKGAMNPIRRAARGGGLPILAPLVEAIPEDDGLGLLKAGIIILANAVKRRSQACDKIFDCFSNVPQLIRQTQDMLRRFSTDEDVELRSCANHLFSVLIECLPHLINILLRQSGQSKLRHYAGYGKAIFVDEVADMEKLLQPLTAARRALEQRVARLNDKRHDKTGKKVDEISRETTLIRQNQHQHQHELKSSIGSLDYNAGRIYHQTGRIESKVETVLDIVSEQNAYVNRIHEENAALKDRIRQLEILSAFHMLAEEKRRNQVFYEEAPGDNHRRLQGQSSPPSNTALVLNLDQLFTILCDDFETGSHARDLYSVLEQYHFFSEKALAQAAYLSERPEFREWLVLRNSGCLLVDGHCGEHTSQRVSPLSVFCATVVQSLVDMSSSSQDIVLYFFCGQHIYGNRPFPGPQGLFRSLTTQILLALGSEHIVPSLEFLRTLPGLASNSHPRDIDIQTIGQIFSSLLSQLPSGTTIHCVIEDVAQFETTLDGWAEEMRMVVDCLQWCVFNTSVPVFLKPLYTSAEASIVIHSQVPLIQQIDLRSGDYYSSVSSPRALMMELSNQLSFSEPQAEEQLEQEHILSRYKDASSLYKDSSSR